MATKRSSIQCNPSSVQLAAVSYEGSNTGSGKKAMFSRRVTNGSLAFLLIAFFIFAGSRFLTGAHAALSVTSAIQENSNSTSQRPTPSPKPTAKDEEILPSEDILRTETNLTNIFFSAEDKNKRYISTLK